MKTRLRLYRGGALDEQDAILRRQLVHRQAYERWERRQQTRRFVIALAFAFTLSALAGFVGYLIGCGGAL
jgi:hypothetical protein